MPAVSARAGRWLCGALALLAGAEIAAWGVQRVLTRRMESRPDPRHALPQFLEYSWAERYWVENSRVRLRYEYHPWVGQRRSPYEGETITIDPHGRRRTLHSSCSEGAPQVWLFGGSTLWGYGAPDALTIPSLLAERLAAEGRPACLVSYGELGRTSTTEVVELMLALGRTDDGPEAVVFYDGCNDVLKAWSRALGAGAGVEAVLLDFQRETDRGSFRYLGYSNLATLASRLANRFFPRPANPGVSDVAGLARDVAARYLANAELAGAMARSRGAAALLALQPVIYAGRKPVHPAERQRLADTVLAPEGQLERVFAESYAAILSQAPDSLHDLSGVLDEVESAVYFDVCHVTPEANAVVAAELARELMPLLDGRAVIDTSESGR